MFNMSLEKPGLNVSFSPICQVAAPAKAGAIAPLDVVVPAQNTGLGPEKTSFFQALSIPTKISKGTIEILVGVPTKLFVDFFPQVMRSKLCFICSL